MEKEICISEHWRKADESIEIYRPGKEGGGGFVTHLKDGEAILFPTIWDMAVYKITGEPTDRVYVDEEELPSIYDNYSGFYTVFNSPDFKEKRAVAEEERMQATKIAAELSRRKEEDRKVYVMIGRAYTDHNGEVRTTELFDETKGMYYYLKS